MRRKRTPQDTRRSRTFDRRKFLAAGTTAATALTIVPAYVVRACGQTPPSEKLNIAGVGIGGMGSGDIRNCAGENIVALCDVDWAHARLEAYAAARAV